MDMEDRLPSVAVGVEHCSIAARVDAQLFRKARGSLHQHSDQQRVRVLHVIHRRDVLLGYDE